MRNQSKKTYTVWDSKNGKTFATLSEAIHINIISIGNNAFAGCLNSLKTLTIKNAKLQTLGDNCFSGCGNLSIVYFDGTKEEWASIKKGENWDRCCGANNYRSGYWLSYYNRVDSDFIVHNWSKG